MKLQTTIWFGRSVLKLFEKVCQNIKPLYTHSISLNYINRYFGKQSEQGKCHFQCKIVNIFLPIIFSICFGCSKDPPHRDGSFEYPQHMFWLKNKNFLLWNALLTKGLVNIETRRNNPLVYKSLWINTASLYSPWQLCNKVSHCFKCLIASKIYELWHVISNNVVFWNVYTQTSLGSLFLSLKFKITTCDPSIYEPGSDKTYLWGFR